MPADNDKLIVCLKPCGLGAPLAMRKSRRAAALVLPLGLYARGFSGLAQTVVIQTA